jgi:(2Fe-2S) ferredoxin
LTATGAPVGHPLLLVCTHGKHDRCCARYGRPLYTALCEQADDEWVWQSSHVGGDRFAGNVVVLPQGLYYGRVEPADAWALLEEHAAGRIHLERYRGRSCYRFREQAAERVVREHARALGIDDLTLLASERDRVTFRADDRVFELAVEETSGPLTYLTCSSESLRNPRHYAARILRESAA